MADVSIFVLIFLLHHRRKLRIADQLDNNLCNGTVQQFLTDLLFVIALVASCHGAVFAAVVKKNPYILCRPSYA